MDASSTAFNSGFGKAPKPHVPFGWISASAPSDAAPGMFIRPTTMSSMGGQAFTISRYYWVKDKTDGSYFVNENNEGQIKESFKEQMVVTPVQAKYMILALMKILERFGIAREEILKEN